MNRSLSNAMPFPFLFLALCLAAGILFSSIIPLPILSWLLSLLASLVCGWLFFSIHKNRLAFVFILLTTFLLGACLHAFTDKNFEENSLHRLKIASYADFAGRLYKSPSRGRDRDILFIKVD
ncbi:MAG: hypothetical protein JSV46_04290 [Candidatus Aminicenantes bacterium]|nr:MAG: hypothetical protein JSV46_04290 [Candidatus Aminicenantes bacterium]